MRTCSSGNSAAAARHGAHRTWLLPAALHDIKHLAHRRRHLCSSLLPGAAAATAKGTQAQCRQVRHQKSQEMVLGGSAASAAGQPGQCAVQLQRQQGQLVAQLGVQQHKAEEGAQRGQSWLQTTRLARAGRRFGCMAQHARHTQHQRAGRRGIGQQRPAEQVAAPRRTPANRCRSPRMLAAAVGRLKLPLKQAQHAHRQRRCSAAARHRQRCQQQVLLHCRRNAV